MDALLLMIVPFVGFIIAYWTYGRWLGRKIFGLDDTRPVPAEFMHDGIDYVPTRKGIIFGHHYTSIAGTGPIVGPAIGIIWGWVPAIIWVVVGSIFMGAVHDFGSLVVSMRNQGKSLSEVTARYINPRVRTVFFGIVFLELLIVIAVFGLVIAVLFAMVPNAVFPIWMEIPIAVGLGYVVYRKGGNVTLFTILAVTAMYVTVLLGHLMPGLAMPDIGFLREGSILSTIPATGIWTILLLIYAFIASTLPVTTLLQPRDYINAWQLFIVMALLVAGVVGSAVGGGLHIVAPAVRVGKAAPADAPPFWPFLFVTIACGAISGFHSLVSSGTSSKQVCRESHARFVGFGSMLFEGALAVLVIVAVAAGIGMVAGGDLAAGREIWQTRYVTWSGVSKLGDKVGAVVDGSANMIATYGITTGLGAVIMGVFIASFAGTTLDTATRIQRYAIAELASSFRVPGIGNRYAATALAVITAGALAFSTGAGGAGAMTLWPMFGAVNQLLAALALLVVTSYLKTKGGRKYLVTAIPCAAMLVITLVAVVYNQVYFMVLHRWLLAVINAAALALAVWLVVEAVAAFRRKRGEAESGPAAAEPAAQPGSEAAS